MDWQGVGAQAILALIPVVTVVVVWLIRKVAPKLPKFAVPWVAMLLGTLITYVQGLAGGPDVSPLIAALLGGAATWLYEVVKELKLYLSQ